MVNPVDVHKGVAELFAHTNICTEPGALKNVVSMAMAAANGQVPRSLQTAPKGDDNRLDEEGLLERGDGIKHAKVVMDQFVAKDLFSVGIVYPSEEEERGAYYVSALGLLSRKDDGLQLNVTPKIREAAIGLAKKVRVKIDYDKKPPYVDVTVSLKNGNIGQARIEGSHTNVTEIMWNGKTLYSNHAYAEESNSPAGIGSDKYRLSKLSVKELYDIAQELDGEAYEIVRRAVEMNRGSMHQARERNLFDLSDLKELELDPKKRAKQYTKALVRERMEGVGPDVMAVCGSGNKGIETMSSIIAYSEVNPKGDEALTKAAAFGCLIANKISGELGVLSSACGCVWEAAPSAAASIGFYKGASVREIEESIKHVFNSTGGVVCTGAGPHSCPDKLEVGIEAVYAAVQKASQVDCLLPGGLVDESVDKTIHNYGKLAESMKHSNKAIVDVMLEQMKARTGPVIEEEDEAEIAPTQCVHQRENIVDVKIVYNPGILEKLWTGRFSRMDYVLAGRFKSQQPTEDLISDVIGSISRKYHVELVDNFKSQQPGKSEIVYVKRHLESMYSCGGFDVRDVIVIKPYNISGGILDGASSITPILEKMPGYESFGSHLYNG